MNKRYFTDNGFLLIGKYKGTHFKKLERDYLKWAKQNIPDFANQLHKARKRQRKANEQFRAGHKEPWKAHPPKPVNDSPFNPQPAKQRYARPTPKNFKSRSKRIVGATLD